MKRAHSAAPPADRRVATDGTPSSSFCFRLLNNCTGKSSYYIHL